MMGCAYALIRGGRIVRSGAVGLADPRSGRRLRAHTPMRVASISKVATALLVMKLMEDGRLSLDADIADLLGPWARNPAFPDAAIHVRMLLSHTSSMRDGAVYWAPLGARTADFFTPGAALWEHGAHWDSAHAPGRSFTYCNLGFGVLGAIIERVCGARFDLFAHAALFGPLGLECGFNWSECPPRFMARGSPIWQRAAAADGLGPFEAQVDDPLPHGRVFLNPDNLPLTDYRLAENGTLFSPQGGLRASARDLAAFGLLLLHEGAPLLRPETMAAMQAAAWTFDGANGQTDGGYYSAHGLSLHIIAPSAQSPLERQLGPLIGHAGDAYGLRGGVWVDPSRDAGFVFLFNGGPQDERRAPGARSAFSRPEEIAMQLFYDAAIG
ncbi:MAG: serine hydrolase domain-containing protein [Hyphomonadaceae bacterium]